MRRLPAFLRSLRALRRHGIPLTRWNVRAMWIQSDPDWLAKLPVIDLTDAEWDEYLNLMGIL